MNTHGIPGQAVSYWLATSADTNYPSLEEGLTVDVAVIGGGLVGISSALALKEAGLTVAVLEGNRICGGVTGYTTAKITSLHGLTYARIAGKFGKDKARKYGESNQAAIEKIASMVEKGKIACDFSRLPFYIYALTEESLRQIETEVKISSELGLPASFTMDVPLPFSTKGAIRFDNQAQFHPGKFLKAVTASIHGDGCHIFENTRVTDIEYGKTCRLITERGKIKADNVIVATNFPIFDKEGLYFARLEPKLSYVVAINTKQTFPDAMFIDADDSGYAWRAQPNACGKLIIITGHTHKPGHGGDTTKYYKDLELKSREVYVDSQIEYSWATQDNSPYDGLPYIGKLSFHHNNVFVATGFNQWGMTTSVVASGLLNDLIQGKENELADVYNPLRIKADLDSAKNFISQNTHVAKEYINEHLTSEPEVSTLAAGEGKIVTDKGKKIAEYKDENGQVFRLNPTCTHMGCTVNWNNAERSWDCPCHGSRYSYTGEVIHSPTVKRLKQIE